jgi:hypothetical protein
VRVREESASVSESASVGGSVAREFIRADFWAMAELEQGVITLSASSAAAGFADGQRFDSGDALVSS